jgi:hypothetical protein
VTPRLINWSCHYDSARAIGWSRMGRVVSAHTIQRWLESEKLWQTCLGFGGWLEPEPDTQSPFLHARAPRPRPAHRRIGVRVLQNLRPTFQLPNVQRRPGLTRQPEACKPPQSILLICQCSFNEHVARWFLLQVAEWQRVLRRRKRGISSASE